MGLYHFILTRFNLFIWTKDKEGNKVRSMDWLKHRFALFERFCLPSIKAQTSNDFEWIVLFDSSTPEEFKEKINQYKAECPQMSPVFVEPKNGRRFAEIFRTEVLLRLSTYNMREDDRILTTYLDNDDALNVRFVEDLQKRMAALPNGTFLYYTDGLQLLTDHMYLMHICHPRNHFVSVVERANPTTLKTIYGYGSHYFIDRIPGVKIERVTKQPMWCEVVHERNMGNDAFSYKAKVVKDTELLAADYGLQEDVHYYRGQYLFRFLPRYIRSLVRICKARIRGRRFE